MEKKAAEAEARISSSATKKEALENAITAIENYIQASKQASSGTQRAKYEAKSKELLAWAERIKNTKTWTPSVHPGSANKSLGLRPPSSQRTLSTREEVILLEGSKLHGCKFPPWKTDPNDEIFIRHGDELYEDFSELALSDSQLAIFDGWKRPCEALAGQQLGGETGPVVPVMTAAAESIDLVQDVTTDCSVVASLCASTARLKHGHDTGKYPRLSENGKYVFRFHFNGCYRLVTIDDRLPTSTSARTLHVIDRRNPTLLWPALLEKAYLKVRGGYNFPGSNSGTDLWILTGWIPEQIFLQSDDVRSDQLWQRVYKAYGYGDVIITMGTGRVTSGEERSLGLVGEHDYAILQLKEQDGMPFVLVKNPWCEGNVFTQSNERKQSTQASIWTQGLQEALPSLASTEPGTFWMSFDKVIQHFESLYLNWNPGLFRHRQDHHFTWTLPKISSPGSFVHNPQYSITSAKANTVWVLLSRHFKTEESDILNRSAHTLADAASSLGFISLYAFDNGGRRVHLSDNALLRGPFVDSPQTLLRFEMPANKAYTVVVAQESLPLEKYSFTLSVFSSHQVAISEALDRYKHHVQLSGSWTPSTAGGNASSTIYSSNPQYRIDIPSPTPLLAILEASPADLPVHIEIVWSNGSRIPAVTNKDILAASGDYRRGHAVMTLPSAPAGAFTIVASTFEPHQLGSFELRIATMLPCTVRPLPSEGAGRLRTALMPAVFTRDVDRLLAPLSSLRLTRMMVVARHSGSTSGPGSLRIGTGHPSFAVRGGASPLRVSLERGQGPNKTVLATSGLGEFQGLATGVRCPDVDVAPEMNRGGGLWLVLERLPGADVVERVEVEILSESGVEVGVWGTGDG